MRRSVDCHMTPAAEPRGVHGTVKSGSLLRRLALRRFSGGATVVAMNHKQQAANLPSIEWERIFCSYRPLAITYSPKEMICQAGSYVAGIHLIVQGVVADMMLTQAGEPRDHAILSVGDLIGIEILDGNTSRLSTSLYRAVTRVDLLFIERKQFQSAVEDHPFLQQQLVGHLVNRYVSARQDPRDKASAEARLGHLLLRLGQACGTSNQGGRVMLPSEITLRTLGEILCVSTRQLRQARLSLAGLEIRESGIEFDSQEVLQLINDECPALM